MPAVMIPHTMVFPSVVRWSKSALDECTADQIAEHEEQSPDEQSGDEYHGGLLSFRTGFFAVRPFSLGCFSKGGAATSVFLMARETTGEVIDFAIGSADAQLRTG